MISSKNLVSKIWIQSVSLLLSNDTSWKKFITCKSYLQSFWNTAFKSCVPKIHGPKCKRWLEFLTLHFNWAQKSILQPNLGSKKFHVELWCSLQKHTWPSSHVFVFLWIFCFHFCVSLECLDFCVNQREKLCASMSSMICFHVRFVDL